MKDLKKHIETITKPVIRKNGFVTPQIIFDWPLIVGDYLAKYTTPLKIIYPQKKNSDGTLHIEVVGVMAPLIQQLEVEIIEKIATYFGFKAITRIKLIQTKAILDDEIIEPKPLNDLDAMRLDNLLADIEDIELKEKLKSIGTHILRKNHE